jgi:GNAT superfamily N-acetyltransferase
VTWSKVFVELNKVIHDRASFNCGEAELNSFIQARAARHMEAGISRTMVLPAIHPLLSGKYPICAFYAIAPGSIKRNTLPDQFAKKLPTYPIPVFLLAQLAVHAEYRGQGLGKITLIKALEYLWDINAHMRAYAIIVDCLNEKAETFYARYGFEPLYTQKGRLRMFLPMKVVGQLFRK